MVGHVSQFQLSQSHGRDRLLESGQFDSGYDQLCCWQWHWRFFFLAFSLFGMQNNSSRLKNEKSTVRKTRPTLAEKMAMLEEIYAGGEPLRFCSCSWSINQSINHSLINWNCWKFYQQSLSGKKNGLVLRTSKSLFQNLCVENKRGNNWVARSALLRFMTTLLKNETFG